MSQTAKIVVDGESYTVELGKVVGIDEFTTAQVNGQFVTRAMLSSDPEQRWKYSVNTGPTISYWDQYETWDDAATEVVRMYRRQRAAAEEAEEQRQRDEVALEIVGLGDFVTEVPPLTEDTPAA